jgi:hypothetical protein
LVRDAVRITIRAQRAFTWLAQPVSSDIGVDEYKVLFDYDKTG